MRYAALRVEGVERAARAYTPREQAIRAERVRRRDCARRAQLDDGQRAVVEKIRAPRTGLLPRAQTVARVAC